MRLSNRRGRGGSRVGSRDSGLGSDRGASTPVPDKGPLSSPPSRSRAQLEVSDEVASAAAPSVVSQTTGSGGGAKKKRNRRKKTNDVVEGSQSRRPSASGQVTIEGVTNDCSKNDDDNTDGGAKSSSVVSFDQSSDKERYSINT